MTMSKITPERREQRKKLLELLQGAGINDVAGLQDIFKEMAGAVLEHGIEGELEEELGYISTATGIKKRTTAAMGTAKRR